MQSFGSRSGHSVAAHSFRRAGTSVVFLLALGPIVSQAPASIAKANSASAGSAQVSNDDRCWEFITVADRRTTGCLISHGEGPDDFQMALQIEVGLKSGRKILITPGGPIREWHFNEDGRQIAISFVDAQNQASNALYDTATGNLIGKVDLEPHDLTKLPQWAKDQAELDDESVPEGADLNKERTKWVAKIMRQIETIRPGMKRKDLDELFTVDGGVSMRTEQRYVLRECDCIKIDVRFKTPPEARKGIWEDPEDVIESVSKPYLEWPIMD